MDTPLVTKTDLLIESEVKPIYIVTNIERPKEKFAYSIIKRFLDIILSLIGMIVMSIPSIIIMVLIKCDSKGPIIYKQTRLGKHEKPFTIYKFRTMKVDAEKDGMKWASENDERCTRVGAKLRKYRLDELPQLWNIFTGKMSLVGPRPEREYFYNQFATYIYGFHQRMYVLPGLTGLAQINGGYSLKPEEKIVYDLEYIERRSLLLDLMIIFKTFAIVFNHNGAR